MKYIDSPNIQINCYPVNHYEVIPLQVDINFADFRSEKVVEMNGTKANVFALLWMQHGQISEFHIAIDDDTQFKNYESYLNNLMKICRIAENGKCLRECVPFYGRYSKKKNREKVKVKCSLNHSQFEI